MLVSAGRRLFRIESNRSKPVRTPEVAARAGVRCIDRETAMRILEGLASFRLLTKATPLIAPGRKSNFSQIKAVLKEHFPARIASAWRVW